MSQAFLALGSNIEPARNIERALARLKEQTRLLAFSTVWRSAPQERPEQDDYYNCVALIETALPPDELKNRVLRGIETELGRLRTEDRYAPRTVDLDLILYDDLVLQTDDLVLPDPDIAPQHAILRGADTYFILKDLSLGGTFIDGKKVEEALLRDGQTISLGHTKVIYREKRG